MNNIEYEWKCVLEEGQTSFGYLDIIETIAEYNGEMIKIQASIHFFPNLDQFNGIPMCSVTIFYESTEEQITRTFTKWIMADIGSYIKSKENNKFKGFNKKVNLIMSQNFCVEKIPTLEYLSSGDFSI